MAPVVVSLVAVTKARAAMDPPIPATGFKVPGLALFARECTDANLCQKPVGGNMGTIIGVSVAIPFVVGLVVLFFLHRRTVRRQRLEDMRDPHKSLDFGLGETGGKEPRGLLHRQMSLDMNLASPYLLPPEMEQSRRSLGSLARSMHQSEDPYRHVSNIAASDAISIKSERSRSVLSGTTYGRESSRTGSRSTTMDTVGSTGTGRKGSLPPKSPLSPVSMESALFPTPPTPVYNQAFSPRLAEPVIPEIMDMPPQEPIMLTHQEPIMLTHQEPVPAALQIARKPASMQKDTAYSAVDMHVANPGDYGTNAHQDVNSEQPPPRMSSLAGEPLPASLGSPRHEEAPPPPVVFPAVEYQGYQEYAQMPQIQQMPQMPQVPQMPQMPEEHEQYPEHVDEARGRNMQRPSHVYEQDALGGGLSVPQQNNRRLSVGFRPLPPDEIMESGDPEYRASRIRSFYKEYFEDGRREPMPPLPEPVYSGYGGHGGYGDYGGYGGYGDYAGHGGHGGYYEDYDANYGGGGGETAYFDPDSNAFVMPYAQPVARRAMTPPPSGQRFPGPRGAARRPHGGSASSSPMRSTGGGYSRPGSSASSYIPGRTRAGSTMSGGRLGTPRKAMAPPPMSLNTLPTPSKLRDDSFALMGAANFAPPDSFADRAAGRSQSPAGERRPYKLNVPVASPLVTAFTELSDLPSPHKLRKSNTFTALDFAPPPKLGDADDARSETGSIRSNRSGISAKNLGAIRSGAGRVSRLPGDHVFTQAAMAEQLKPQWGMRP